MGAYVVYVFRVSLSHGDDCVTQSHVSGCTAQNGTSHRAQKIEIRRSQDRSVRGWNKDVCVSIAHNISVKTKKTKKQDQKHTNTWFGKIGIRRASKKTNGQQQNREQRPAKPRHRSPCSMCSKKLLVRTATSRKQHLYASAEQNVGGGKFSEITKGGFCHEHHSSQMPTATFRSTARPF